MYSNLLLSKSPIQRGDEVTNLVELLQYRVQAQGNQDALIFLGDGERETDKLTYQELDQQARAISAQLQQSESPGARALLLYPPGLEFVAAFFGCLYAGVVAVPAYPPRRDHFDRLDEILSNSGAKVALSTNALLKGLDRSNNTIKELTWIATDKLSAHEAIAWQPPAISPESLAFLQYTSGSTGRPKGVMVSHRNLLHNCEQIYQGFGHSPSSRGVIWLPLYHDMGLIGGVLQPLYGGFPCQLMSPLMFLQKPLRWLQAVSRSRATTSGGPNFAYDLCLRKITPQQRETLDLSSWQVAFSGAEPVRAETLKQFADTFADCGFRHEAFYPCYGLAEATLFVSGGKPQQPPAFYTVDATALKQGQGTAAQSASADAQVLVGCGSASPDQELAIVDPNTTARLSAGEVGEIWVAGASVAQGYWQQPDKTEETFSGYLRTGEGPFLRTGDLGFVRPDGELFVTGRLKDVIVIRGRNHYPQDIEATVEQCHSAVRPSCSAAFALEVEGQERLVVAAEVERRCRKRPSQQQDYQGPERRKRRARTQAFLDEGVESTNTEPYSPEAVIASIQEAVTKNHGLQVYAVLLLRVASIPKTSSGKVRRHACRTDFLARNLLIVGQWCVNPQQLSF